MNLPADNAAREAAENYVEQTYSEDTSDDRGLAYLGFIEGASWSEALYQRRIEELEKDLRRADGLLSDCLNEDPGLLNGTKRDVRSFLEHIRSMRIHAPKESIVSDKDSLREDG